MVLTGYARRVAADLAPAAVIDPARVAAGDPAEIAAGCLAGVDPGVAERVREGDVLVVAGAMLDGPGAEGAVIALQAAGFAAVICAAAAGVLRAAGAAYGLPVIVAPAAARALAEGELLRLDLERGGLAGASGRWATEPLAAAELAAVRRSQLLARTRRVVEDEGLAEG